MPIHSSHEMYYGECRKCLSRVPSVQLASECEGRALMICVSCNGFRQHVNMMCSGILEPIHKTHELYDADDDEKRPYCSLCGARKGVELRARCTKIRVHDSHRMDGCELYNTCQRCGDGVKDQNLLEECPGVKDIHPSHRFDGRIWCEDCKGFSDEDLHSVCPVHDREPEEDVTITVKPEKVNFQLYQNYVWVVYEWDQTPRAVSIHVTPEEAIEMHNNMGGYQRIGKWPFGMELHEAVKKWESRNE